MDHLVDILEWDYTIYDEGFFDIIFASPPCNSFSSMLFIHKHINIEEKMQNEGLPLLYKTREIIDYFKPKYYFIENPQTGRMKNFITDLPFYDVFYCMYGYSYKKPTRIWTNIENFYPEKCIHKKHSDSIGATRTGEKKPLGKWPKTIRSSNMPLCEKYSIPPNLLKNLFNCINI